MPVTPQLIGRRRIMARGSHVEPVFADDTDRKLFLETLGEACAMTAWRIPTCVLMVNHYHLPVQTDSGNAVCQVKESGPSSFQGDKWFRDRSAWEYASNRLRPSFIALPPHGQ